MGLRNGLFADEFETDSYVANAFYAFDDLLTFGLRIGIPERRVSRQLIAFQQDYALVRTLVRRSFLSDLGKETYLACYESRLQRFNYSLSDNQ